MLWSACKCSSHGESVQTADTESEELKYLIGQISILKYSVRSLSTASLETINYFTPEPPSSTILVNIPQIFWLHSGAQVRYQCPRRQSLLPG